MPDPWLERPDWMAPQGEPWTCLSTTPVYDNPWISLTDCRARAPTGNLVQYGLIHFKNRAIGILPLYDNGDTVLVGQHRFPARDYTWEIPEGGGPLNEAPLDTARRELREEAGLEASDWRLILSYQVSNSVTDEHGHSFIALGLTGVAVDPDETEDLRVRRVPFREALDIAAGGGMLDLITQATLLRAYHMAREGALPAALAAAMLQAG